MQINNSYNQRGITFLEALVTIAIVGFGFAGLLALSAANIRAAESSTNTFIGSNLATEGVEIVRRIRDTNWLQDAPDWLQGITPGTYSVAYASNNLGIEYDSFLRVDPTTGAYQYGAGNPSLFKRGIVISVIDPTQIKVEVSVSWSERGKQLSISVEDRLYNWK